MTPDEARRLSRVVSSSASQWCTLEVRRVVLAGTRRPGDEQELARLVEEGQLALRAWTTALAALERAAARTD